MQAKFIADKIEQEGRAKAAANMALKKAGLTPQQAAEWNYKTKVSIAEQLAKRPVPEIIMIGSENQSGLANSYTIDQMLLLSDKIANKRNE